MSESKSYEDVLEDNRVQEKNDVTDIPVFKISPNYKGKNPKSPEELAKMYEERKAKREAKKTATYESTDKMVNHPNHYKVGKYEAIDIMKEATKDMTGAAAIDTSNALKYILRWDKKGTPVRDLEKAVFYLTDLISELKKTE